jgi:uncharacterized protein
MKISVLLLTLFLIGSCKSKTSHASKGGGVYVQEVQSVDTEKIPEPIGYVNDFDSIYTLPQRKVLDSLLKGFDKMNGIQIALLTVDQKLMGNDDINSFTLKVGNRWGVGDSSENNGLMIGICAACRNMRIQTGEGIEKRLPDEEVKKIIDRDFVPNFKTGDFYKGTIDGLKQLMIKLQSVK